MTKLSGKSNSSKSKQAIRVAVQHIPTNLHPFATFDEEIQHVRGYLHPPMISLTPRFNWVCHLCTTLPDAQNGLVIEEHQSGGKRQLVVTFELRPDLRWSDGTPVTGEDVLFSWTVAQAADNPSPALIAWQAIDQVKLNPTSPRLFNIFVKPSQTSFFHLRHLYLLPKHLESKIWTKHQANYRSYLRHSHYATTPKQAGLYLGAFIPHSKIKNPRQLNLTTNPHSLWSPKITQINIKKRKDAWAAWRENHFDLIAEEFNALRKIKKNLPAAWTKNTNGHYRLAIGDTNSMETLFLNLRSPNLMDQSVRQALATGINRETILDSLFSGFTLPAAGVIHPQSDYFSLTSAANTFDRNQATRIFEAQRWLSSQNEPRSKGHKKLILNLATDSSPHRRHIAELIKKDFAQLNVPLSIHIYSAKEFHNRVIARADFDDILLASIDRPINYSLKPFFHKDLIPTVRNGYTGFNLSQWINIPASRLLDSQFKQSLIPHAATITQLQKIINQELPVIPLYFYLKAAIHRTRVSGLILPVNFHPSSMASHNWQITH